MFIITAYPLAVTFPSFRGGAFTYFSRACLARGALVRVPLGKKSINAIVARSEPLQKTKAALKRSAYQLKKVDSVLFGAPFFRNDLLDVSEKIANYYLQQEGAVLKTFFPQQILASANVIGALAHPKMPKTEEGNERRARFVAGDLDKRLGTYSQEIKCAKNGSIWIIAPTIALVEYIAAYLARENPNPVVINAGLGKEKLIERWKTARDGSPPLVIGTPIALGAMPLHTVTLIIDNASSAHFRTRHLPFFNIREALELFATHAHLPLIIGSAAAFPDDLYKIGAAAYAAKTIQRRCKIPVTLIDMQKEKDASASFPILSGQLIKELNGEKSRAMLFVNRRGRSPLIICRDCGTPIRCPYCSSPITLHQTTDLQKRVFLCHHCGKTISSDQRCKSCDGWNLKAYGIGTQRIEEEIKKRFPERLILRMDRDGIKNERTRKKMASEFMGTANAILIGTEMLLEEPALRANTIGIISVDHLFSLPDFRMHEYILRLLIELKYRGKACFAQTFFHEHPLMRAFAQNTHRAYFAEELKERKEAFLPPYAVLIKLVAADKNESSAEQAAKALCARITRYSPTAYATPAFIPKEQGLYKWHVLLFLPRETWIRNAAPLKTALRGLGREWSVIVDPSSAL